MNGYALRFYRDDIGPEDGPVSLPAGIRTVCTRSGAIHLDGVSVDEDDAWFGDGATTLECEGATVWRCEFARQAYTPVLLLSANSVLLLESPLAALPPDDGLMMRCDSVAFSPDGCNFTHTHKGPGISYLQKGTSRTGSDGHSSHLASGEPWFEAGPVPVFAQAVAELESRSIRISVLPHALEGKSSITYVLEEDRDKLKNQTYRGYFDRLFEI